MKLLVLTILFSASLGICKWTCPFNSTTRVITLVSAATGYDSWGNCINDAVTSAGNKNLAIELGSDTLYTNHTGDSLTFYNSSNIVIRGAPATIKFGSVFKSIYLKIMDSENIFIEKLTFKGFNWAPPGDTVVVHRAIHVESDQVTSRNIFIRNCGFSGFKTGGILLGPRVENAAIEKNSFDDVDHQFWYGAIHIDRSKNISINDNNYVNLTCSAISLRASESISITNDTAYFDTTNITNSMGIYANGGLKNSTINNNYLRGMGLQGIILSSRQSDNPWIENSGNIISNNTIYTYGYGVVLQEAPARYGMTNPTKYNQLLNNKVYGLATCDTCQPIFGIYARNSSYNIFKGSEVSNFTGKFIAGIAINDTTAGDSSIYNIVVGNKVKGVRNDAIDIQRSTLMVRNEIDSVPVSAVGIKIRNDAAFLMYKNSFYNCTTMDQLPTTSANIYRFEN